MEARDVDVQGHSASQQLIFFLPPVALCFPYEPQSLGLKVWVEGLCIDPDTLTTLPRPHYAPPLHSAKLVFKKLHFPREGTISLQKKSHFIRKGPSPH